MHHLFGIRHHGPGSARSLRRALEELRPDIVLVEGPPDADGLLPLFGHADLRPPVALLIYAEADLKQAVYYPLARFSPEWQAIGYAIKSSIPVRFMDLPQRYMLAFEQDESEGARADLGGFESLPGLTRPPSPLLNPSADPLGALAAAAGYADGERWWEHMVEHRRDGADLFAAVTEAMAALREGAPPLDPREALREAWMRRTIAAAEGEGFQRIAVVCGAWHAPALGGPFDAAADAKLLKGLPQIKTAATLAPWTYGRLSYASGYGAGIESPGWYDHLWESGEAGHGSGEVVVRWMTRVARLLRGEDLDASAAHVIEAVRLAEALAALRGLALPGLAELDEATRAVLCFGADEPMRLIRERLVISERLGGVPDETPAVPLQQDLQREQRRLRMKVEADWHDLDLDLREPNDRARSALLRRLGMLGVPWGALGEKSGKGTFREQWRIRWQPEFAVALIEAGVWGTTVAAAAASYAQAAAERAATLRDLVAVVSQALLADLPDAVGPLMALLQERSAHTGDVEQLMDALVVEDPQTRDSLVRNLRYGNVRQTDGELVRHVVDGLIARICIGLAGACAALNDDSARAMFGRIVAVDSAITTLQQADQEHEWQGALLRVADLPGAHGLVAGRACRLLLDDGRLAADEVGRRLSLALSQAADPAAAAAWVEGLLHGSGLILAHDDRLWQIIDGWVGDLRPDLFQQVLPLLRRTFATFPKGERRMLGERAAHGPAKPALDRRADADFDIATAERALDVARLMLRGAG